MMGMWSTKSVLLAAAMIGMFGRCIAGEVVAVSNFNHRPNYVLCTDSDDMHQLVDGKLANFPSWTRRETVGWESVSPVAIQLRLKGAGGSMALHKGRLRIHSAKGSYAGVDVPRRVDVYSRGREGKYYLVGSVAPNPMAIKDNSGNWLDVIVSAAGEELVVVAHANGEFLFLDEIQWESTGVARESDAGIGVDSVQAVINDSIHRLSQSFVEQSEKTASETALVLKEKGSLVVWVQDPWSEFHAIYDRATIQNADDRILITGYAAEHESRCLGVVVGEDLAGSEIAVSIEGMPPNVVRLSEVGAVFAADGTMVFDPLVPLNAEGELRAKAGRPKYIWLDFDLSRIKPGVYSFRVNVRAGRTAASVPGVATVSPLVSRAPKKVKAINWAYLSDRPIFNNRKAATHDLLLHGINVFVSHPTSIPGVAIDGKWSTAAASGLADTVKLAQESGTEGTVLLYLGWNADQNPLGLLNEEDELDPETRERLLSWVGKIDSFLQRRGMPRERWALYPVDEPDRGGLRLLKVIAEAVKSQFPSIRIYANPSISIRQPLKSSELQQLEHLVDLWQPNLDLLHGPVGAFFGALKKEWWIYRNPRSPAKRGSPLRDYRMLSWWAWKYGATGVGFWSYSDTGGSSAWNDMDGRRPDWAVVYESDTGVVSSRRWEAFREGLEDFVLMVSNARESVLNAMRLVGGMTLDEWQSADIEKVRSKLLEKPAM